jgi:hypothetical protein
LPRGADIQQNRLFSTVSPGERMPVDHPLWLVRLKVNKALLALDADFNALYADMGR